MPIEIGQIDAEVTVDAAAGGETARQEDPAVALQRWQELARRNDELAARTAAWGFDD